MKNVSNEKIKNKFKKLFEKFNICNYYIERLDNDKHYNILEDFVLLFNKYTGKCAYTIYDSNDYHDWDSTIFLILFSDNKNILDENIEEITKLIKHYEQIEEIDILNLLDEFRLNENNF